MTSGAQASPIGAASAPAVSRGLKALAIRGSLWTVGGYVASQILRLGSNLMLAWMLVPEAFGIMLLVNVFMQGLQMFSDIGIGPSIIQNTRGGDPAFFNTAWTIQVVRGVVLWIIACVLTWPMAWWYSRNDPLAAQLLYLIPVTGFMAVLAGFFSTGLYTLNREMAMGRWMIIHLVSQVAGIVVMVGWALIHPTVWALVGGGLTTYTFKLVMSHVMIPEVKNRLAWDSQCARSLIHFGKWIFLSTAVAFLAAQADRILLGSLIPLELLGVYSFGIMVATLPREAINHLTGMVLFPALSQHGRTHRETLPEKVRLARRTILPTATFACLGVAIVAPLFFQFLYPEHFHGAGWMAQLISISVWFSVLSSTSDRALLAIAQTRALPAASSANLLVTVPAAILGFSLYNLPGFILGYACGSLAALLVVQAWMHSAGMSVYRQDVTFTGLFGVLGAFGIGLPHALSPLLPVGVPDLLPQLVIAAVVLTATAIWALWVTLPTLLKS